MFDLITSTSASILFFTTFGVESQWRVSYNLNSWKNYKLKKKKKLQNIQTNTGLNYNIVIIRGTMRAQLLQEIYKPCRGKNTMESEKIYNRLRIDHNILFKQEKPLLCLMYACMPVDRQNRAKIWSKCHVILFI